MTDLYSSSKYMSRYAAQVLQDVPKANKEQHYVEVFIEKMSQPIARKKRGYLRAADRRMYNEAWSKGKAGIYKGKVYNPPKLNISSSTLKQIKGLS